MSGLRVLVVEDEMLVAMLLEDMLDSMGHEVVGPAHRVESGLDLVEREQIDLAVLDVNLAGTKSFPIADRLTDRGVPFAFATGYGGEGIDDHYPGAPVIAKPFTIEALTDAFAQALNPRGKPAAIP